MPNSDSQPAPEADDIGANARGEVCIVSSCGGHLTEVRCLMPAYEHREHFYVLNHDALLPEDMKDKTLFITHSERDWKTLVNFWEAYKILRRTRPKVLLSTGAGPIVPFAIVGRCLFGTRVVYVESITRIHKLSLSGKIMYWLANDFFYQWKQLEKRCPKGIYEGTVV